MGIYCPPKTEVSRQNDGHDGSWLRLCFSIPDNRQQTPFVVIISGVTGGGQDAPLTFFTRNFLLTYQVKRVKKERENREEKKENLKGKRLKIENGRGKGMKMSRGLFCLFYCLSLFETTEICLGSTKMDNFYRENHVIHGEIIRKTDFAPSEKYSFYATGDNAVKIQTVLFGFCFI